MLDVQHLSVAYGVTEVLRDVSFTVPERSIVALLGGNGSGKTTTLNVLSGLLAPRGGAVRFEGRSIAALPSHEVVRRGIVQVPQGREVWSGMSVRDNLDLGAATRRDRRATRADLEDVFALFPVLRDRQSRKAGTLSGGEQQMLAIGRALMARPRLLLMDEPSAGLSPVVVQAMVAAIQRLHARGLTILLVEQNVGVAAALAEHAHVLMNGEVALSAPAADLLRNPDVLRSYLGR
ncbi:MAG: ABC transporter ATP-binding protein [Candidatus Rokuibacteriota bacterium]|nr:MAG: ABC transporter ATP-binding protein [Candidatus Rokubacteria bacterium]